MFIHQVEDDAKRSVNIIIMALDVTRNLFYLKLNTRPREVFEFRQVVFRSGEIRARSSSRYMFNLWQVSPDIRYEIP
jgi:hypothetical protein